MAEQIVVNRKPTSSCQAVIQIPASQTAVAARDPVAGTALAAASWECEFTGSSVGKYRLRTAHPADLFEPTTEKEQMTPRGSSVAG